MSKKTYNIDYICYDTDKCIIKKGTFKVKNQENEFTAKCSFEDFLKRKYKNFGSLVIEKCSEDYMNIFRGFNTDGGFSNTATNNFMDIFDNIVNKKS